MGIDITWLFSFALAYLALLFLIAWATDSGWLPERLVSHPVVYCLSLGVYATSWTYYGSVGLADSSGYAFLTIYLGVTAAFLLGPYLLAPLLRLCREHQLTSIADLLAFRYGGRVTGLLVTLFMLVGILPYVSLQIHAVTESVQVLSREVPSNLLALTFCVVISVFAVLFGARHLTPREKHQGLVVAIAFESAVKLIALLVAGLFALTQVFDSPLSFAQWSADQPEMLEALYEPVGSSQWSTLLLLAFCAAFLLPRQYHMTFAENTNPRHLKAAYWLFPTYLLLLNLPIIPILFAGRHLSLSVSPDFYVLGMTLTAGHEWLAILVFIGGLSAASAMMIVTTLALSNMCLNHILLPASIGGDKADDFYSRLLWSKRIVIALIIAAGYGFYVVIELNAGLASLGLISFVAAAQLLPGVIGLLFWSRATQTGFVLGLFGGAAAWFILLIWPLLAPGTDLLLEFREQSDIWSVATFTSLSINGLLFLMGSLLSRPSMEEEVAAQSTTEQAGIAMAGTGIARSPLHYRYAMQQALGNKLAIQEIERAIIETSTAPDETRPAELQILHEQLERNLTGLVGPTLARQILRHSRPSDVQTGPGPRVDSRLAELKLENSRRQLRGLTRQLDDLRRYLREVLRQLPLGVCSIAADGRVYLWNAAMAELTGIDETLARDKALNVLPAPWNHVLGDFAKGHDDHQNRCRIVDGTKVSTVNLHKAQISAQTEEVVEADASDSDNDVASLMMASDAPGGQVILMEDRTSMDTLEAELAHSERLASIGRLAAGVAHEIGNPLTGIASIAQNLQHDARAGLPDLHDELDEQADDILTQVNRINAIVRSLLSFSHAGSTSELTHERVSIADSVNESIRLLSLSTEHRDIQFEVELPESSIVSGDSNQLVQVFVNLIANACEASPEGGTVRIQGLADDSLLAITISDEGAGIDQALQERIFEPFFTTKPVGQGTGLGLSLVYSIVAKHGGRVSVDDSLKRGTHLVVTLPRLGDDAPDVGWTADAS